jgi:hypothetical protein
MPEKRSFYGTLVNNLQQNETHFITSLIHTVMYADAAAAFRTAAPRTLEFRGLLS